MEPIHDILNDINSIFIGVIWIFHSVKTDRPLSINILHFKPIGISIIESLRNFYSIASAIYRLIVRPVSSEFNERFFFEELNIAFFIKVIRGED
jgi:hypothetical protein